MTLKGRIRKYVVFFMFLSLLESLAKKGSFLRESKEFKSKEFNCKRRNRMVAKKEGSFVIKGAFLRGLYKSPAAFIQAMPTG